MPYDVACQRNGNGRPGRAVRAAHATPGPNCCAASCRENKTYHTSHSSPWRLFFMTTWLRTEMKTARAAVRWHAVAASKKAR